MNVRLRRDTKFVIVLLIFFISIYAGYKRSNIVNLFLPKQTSIDRREAVKVFENTKNVRKITMEFRTENDSEIRQSINDLIFQEDVYTKYSDSKKSYQIYILELPHEKLENEINKFRQLDGLEAEHIISDSDVVMDANVKENLENHLITKNRLQELISKTSSPQSLAKFQSDLERTQAKIDSLNSYVSKQERVMNYDLLYITSINTGGVSVSAKRVIWKFVSVSFLCMIFLIFCLIILYFLTLGLTNLMSVMGIRTARSGRGSSNYNYNNYKSSYGRKVKRIYKDKDGNKTEKVSKK